MLGSTLGCILIVILVSIIAIAIFQPKNVTKHQNISYTSTWRSYLSPRPIRRCQAFQTPKVAVRPSAVPEPIQVQIPPPIVETPVHGSKALVVNCEPQLKLPNLESRIRQPDWRLLDFTPSLSNKY